MHARAAVSRGRAFIKNIRSVWILFLEALLKNILVLPELEYALLAKSCV
jgi:hypothetical protein